MPDSQHDKAKYAQHKTNEHQYPPVGFAGTSCKRECECTGTNSDLEYLPAQSIEVPIGIISLLVDFQFFY